MKKAIIRVVLIMPNAWSETDVIETGLTPLEGVHAYLTDEGLSNDLNDLAVRFGMDLNQWRVEIHEQEENI